MRIYELEDGETDVTEQVIFLLKAWGEGKEEPPYSNLGICGNLMQPPTRIGGCAQICNVFKELGYRNSVDPLEDYAGLNFQYWEGINGERRRKLCLEAAAYLQSNLGLAQWRMMMRKLGLHPGWWFWPILLIILLIMPLLALWRVFNASS